MMRVMDGETVVIQSEPPPEPTGKSNLIPGRKMGARTPPRQLQDYRWVYRHPEGEEGTGIQKTLRELLKKDPGKFMDRLQKLEDGFRSRAPGVKKDGPVVVDEGTDKCIELVERMLAEYKSEAGKQS